MEEGSDEEEEREIADSGTFIIFETALPRVNAEGDYLLMGFRQVPYGVNGDHDFNTEIR